MHIQIKRKFTPITRAKLHILMRSIMGHQWAQLRLSRVQYSKRILGLFIIIGRIQISGKSLLGAILNSCRFWYCAVFSVLSITFVTEIRMT